MPTDTHAPALVLAPEVPYPLAGGGALRTASLVEYLAQTRPVDLIVFRQPGAPDPRTDLPAGLVRDTSVIDLPANGRSRGARAWRNAWRLARAVPPLIDRFAGFEAQVAAAVAGKRYGIGVIEHFWCAPYAGEIGPACAETVLDLHNIESLLHERCAEGGAGLEAFAHSVFGRAALDLERQWLPRFSRVLVPSECDAEATLRIAPGANVAVYPNAIPWIPVPQRGREDVIAFSGNFEYHPNIAAVRFFRQCVWPELRERWPGVTWRLIGMNPQGVRRFTGGDPRIEVAGAVGDAVAELARAKVAVVPILAGSGTRLKILEAWAAGVPVVSTPMGAEGLPAKDSENLLLAGDPRGFAAAVSRLLADEALGDRIGAAGRAVLEREFTWEAAWKRLLF